PTLYCAPIVHRQERGDYQERWQPAHISQKQLVEAKEMAKKVTEALGGAGLFGVEFFLTKDEVYLTELSALSHDTGIGTLAITKKVTEALGGAGLFGVEFFLTKDEVYFSELSPRPHDTGMVTLANTQNFNEFELHLRAIMGWPIEEIKFLKPGASAVILASQDAENPKITGIEHVAGKLNTDLRIFGKPTARPYRRMGVVLTYENENTAIETLVKKAQDLSKKIKVE